MAPSPSHLARRFISRYIRNACSASSTTLSVSARTEACARGLVGDRADRRPPLPVPALEAVHSVTGLATEAVVLRALPGGCLVGGERSRGPVLVAGRWDLAGATPPADFTAWRTA